MVDIETTGNWGNGDRITEIGAMRIRNHQVIDEWHSLINPQRSIPPRITQLTGITNAMVRDAPLFPQIADRFRAFMGDSIFVAQSVNFDYGFIAFEFERLAGALAFLSSARAPECDAVIPATNPTALAISVRTPALPLSSIIERCAMPGPLGISLNLINRKRDKVEQN